MKLSFCRMVVISLAMLWIYCLPGCGEIPVKVQVDKDQYIQAIDRIDQIIIAVNNAIANITNESQTWRTALAELEQKLVKDGQDTLANEVRNTLAKAIRDIDVTVMASTDYIETKLKDNLKAFRLALENARTKVIKSKEMNNVNGIKEALDELANVKVFPEPVATAFIPAGVQLQWKAYAQDSGYTIRVPLLEIRGWGFERPEAEEHRFEVFAATRDKKGKIVKQHPLPLNALYSTTRYLIQIKLDAPGVEFNPDDDTLVFRLGSTEADLRFLPIHHDRPENPEEVKKRLAAEEQKRIAEAKRFEETQRISKAKEDRRKRESEILNETYETVDKGIVKVINLGASTFNFKEKVDGKSRVVILAPNGQVDFGSRPGFLNDGAKIDGESKVLIVAHSVTFQGKIDNGNTRVFVILTKGGMMRVNEKIDGGSKLLWCKGRDDDAPDPNVSSRVENPRGSSEFRRIGRAEMLNFIRAEKFLDESEIEYMSNVLDDIY